MPGHRNRSQKEQSEEAVILSDEESELLGLFNAADEDTRKAVISVLKGEKPQEQNPMAAMMSMFGGAGGAEGADGVTVDIISKALHIFSV